MTRPLCAIPAKTLPPCDLPWGHDGDLHANRGDGFYAHEHDEEHRRRQAAVEAAVCFPLGVLEEVAEVLRHGAAKHRCAVNETGGGQTRGVHIAHAAQHVIKARAAVLRGAPDSVDRTTGKTDLVHAIARLVLARGLELATAGGAR